MSKVITPHFEKLIDRLVASVAQFMETWRKGNQWPARSQGRTASGANMTFCWTDPVTTPSREFDQMCGHPIGLDLVN